MASLPVSLQGSSLLAGAALVLGWLDTKQLDLLCCLYFVRRAMLWVVARAARPPSIAIHLDY